jgi:hypothetical protein
VIALTLAVAPSSLRAETAPPSPATVQGCFEAPLDGSIGGTPVASLTVGGERGWFLIDTGATVSAVDSMAYGLTAGTHVELDAPFCGSAHAVFRAEDMTAYRAPEGGQRGRIGVDILGRLAVAFAYGGASPAITVRAERLDPGDLAARGFVEIDPPGGPGARPNAVPVLGLSIGPVTVPAQLDTGFDDSADPGVVQVNPALLAALQAHGVAMRPIAPGGTLGCSGARVYRRWRIEAAGLDVTATDGNRVAAYPPPLIEVKDDVACGGIAAFAEPFAEIGASWLGRWRTTIVDGPGGTVWISR